MKVIRFNKILITMKNNWKVSKCGYFHLMFLIFSVGSNGFALSFMNFSITFAYKK